VQGGNAHARRYCLELLTFYSLKFGDSYSLKFGDRVQWCGKFRGWKEKAAAHYQGSDAMALRHGTSCLRLHLEMN